MKIVANIRGAFAAEVAGLPEPTLTMPDRSSLASSIRVEYGAYE